jgi:AmiR/NasT family two-component response regulator
MSALVEHRSVDGKRPMVELVRALQAENEQLRTALESGIVIEQAKGALSARFGLRPDEAFELLRGLARSQRRNLHDFAAEVLANGGRLHGDVVCVAGKPL